MVSGSTRLARAPPGIFEPRMQALQALTIPSDSCACTHPHTVPFGFFHLSAILSEICFNSFFAEGPNTPSVVTTNGLPFCVYFCFLVFHILLFFMDLEDLLDVSVAIRMRIGVKTSHIHIRDN